MTRDRVTDRGWFIPGGGALPDPSNMLTYSSILQSDGSWAHSLRFVVLDRVHSELMKNSHNQISWFLFLNPNSFGVFEIIGATKETTSKELSKLPVRLNGKIFGKAP